MLCMCSGNVLNGQDDLISLWFYLVNTVTANINKKKKNHIQ